MDEKTLWGIHAGKIGDAHTLFIGEEVVAIGWAKMGDLSLLQPDREAFKSQLASTYSDTKPGAIPVSAGQLFRFVYEMKIGDLVIYPSKEDRLIYLGEITGDYFHNTSVTPGYPNRRSVKWLNEFPRTRFSQGALYEIGSALSLFQVRNYADEFLAALEGKDFSPTDVEDETIAYVAEEIEQVTKDFILKTLSRELKGHPFAHFVGGLLNAMGYKTRIAPEGPDGGIDIVAHRDELGFEPPIIKAQVKSTEGNIGDPELSALYGKVESNEFGMFITLGGFTKAAVDFARNRSNLRLVDGDELVSLILSNYEQLESPYKGLLSLKRVYIPEALSE